MVLASPEVHDGIPSFGHDVYIYDQYVLLVTYLCLFERPELRLPTDTVPLIETVYSEEIPFDDLPEAIQQELVGAYQDMQKSRHESEFHARQSLVVEPSSKRLLRQPNPALREDAPDIHQAYRALTREAGPSLSLVCLFETEDGLALDPAGRQIIRLDGSLTDEHIKQLLKNAVSVRHGWVIKALAEQPVPDEWQRIPGLRDCRRAVFVKGSYQVPGTKYVLYLDRQFGLSVE